MQSQITAFRNGKYDKQIAHILSCIKGILYVTLFMHVLALIALVLLQLNDSESFMPEFHLNNYLFPIIYGAFYLLIFIGIPAYILLLILNLTYTLVRNQKLNLKPFFKLLIANLCVLLGCCVLIVLES